jgi:GTP-binding protein HflX
VPTIALVGYTNAGKSTLFNCLTGGSAYVADQLFATLDPTLRRVEFPQYGAVIFADTVGFIRNLPHDLIEAFKATLEEVAGAELLLHVVDIHDEDRQSHIGQVDKVLETIEAHHVPRLLVFNKIDQITNLLPSIERDERGLPEKVFISAAQKVGIDELLLAIGEMLGKAIIERHIVLPPTQAKLRATLHARRAILEERVDEEGNYHLTVRLPGPDFDKLFGDQQK